jgi:multisubunit Na+/H+ antiporter MnhF subunit
MQELFPTIAKFLAIGLIFTMLRSSIVMGIIGFVGGIYFTKAQPELADKVMALQHSVLNYILMLIVHSSGI